MTAIYFCNGLLWGIKYQSYISYRPSLFLGFPLESMPTSPISTFSTVVFSTRLFHYLFYVISQSLNH